ncbi:MAG TPA: diaminopimelate decarboxylase [Gemmatimonadales bacterium]|nr:diaminopimelate decarboxylase [Gemmatimonadales bacterium]
MCDGQLADIAAAVGTPAYVYDAGAVRERYRHLTTALARAGVRAHIHYSVKANSNLAVLSLLRSLGAGADIVSAGELARVRAAGFPPGAVVFSGVGKTAAELEEALRGGVGLVNIESAAEGQMLGCLAARLGVRARVGIRVNPDVTTATHPYTQTGEKGMKFGVPLDEALAVARQVHGTPSLELRSVGMHIGSQIASAGPYAAGAGKLAELVADVRAAGVDTLESVDVGGGLGIAYTAAEEALDPSAFALAVAPLQRATGLTLLVEPGRYLVGNAGILLTRVLYRKVSGRRTIAVVDAGMGDLLRPSLYGAEHPIRVVQGDPDAPPETVDVVGPICETGDFLALDRPLPRVEPGTLLAVDGAGAYGFVMSSQYNSRPRPAEVLVDGDRWGVVRDRESPADLMRGERVEPAWR